MSMKSKMTMIERISLDHGVVDFQSAPDEVKLVIYKFALEEIFTVLGQDLQYLPEKYLEDLRNSLQETINGFYYLSNTSIKKDIKLNKTLPSLTEANAYLLSAMTALKGGKGKSVRYFNYLQKCRVQIFEALQQLK